MRKLHRRKALGILLCWVFVSSVFITSLSILIRPTWSPSPWWNTNWNFRKQITLNHTMVTADLQNFPVLIDIIDPDLRDKAQFDGGDIVFVDAGNNTLNQEIEFYEPNSGHLVAWVNIPLLSSTEDTEFCMYYGGPSIANSLNSTAVWDSSFVMVQHLQETDQSRSDSTANRNDGTAYGGIVKAPFIDGADLFDGVDDYVRIANAPSFNPPSAISVELWMNLSLTSDYVNLVNKGNYGQFYLRLGPNAGRTYWYVKFGDGTAASVEGNVGWTWNTWHHVVATLDSSAQTIKVYVDGVEKLSGSFGSGKTIAATTSSVLISDISRRWIRGGIDEVRISKIARSPEWIQTTYNNQRDPLAFYAIGTEETNPTGGRTPLVYDEIPSNEATDIYTNPTLSIHVFDPDGQNMSIIFREKVVNTWIQIGSFNNVQSGTYSANPTNMKDLGTTYYWSIYVTDGDNVVSKTYCFTTTTKILKAKWVAQGVPSGVSGVLAADVNGDGLEEIFHAGKYGVVALRGTDGSTIWSVADSGVKDFAQPQMADLNCDGVLEILVPRETPAGLLALHANNGSTYWNITGLGKETYGSPVVFDIDGTGYPTIFMESTDTSKGLDGTGRLTSLSYDGQILHQTFVWRPCSGGLSIADTDWDGEFELYMGDRYMYLNSTEYGDNDYGKGVQSYWAKNLTLRWSRPEFFTSSSIPMLADVNKDGILDVIVGDMNGGLAVLNSTDGSTIKAMATATAPAHYQPSVHDIDRDGNLELLMADPHDWASDDIVVWDLVKWQVDARMYLGKSFYGPQVADVTGDGIMEIIAVNYRSIFVIDNTYRVIDSVFGLSGEVSYGGEVRFVDGISGLSGTLNYAVVQDIDGDGYNELIVSAVGGYIYAFDTPARRSNPRPRTEVQFYSEYRLGAAEYVQPQGGPAPIISSPYPSNLATNVPLSLSELSFTLADYQYDLMNYTVTTYPHIGSVTGTNIGIGRYKLSLSNLQLSTTYSWTVSATDGTHWTNRTFTFTTQTISGIPWWNLSWHYRKTLTIDHTKVSSDLQNFPFLIDITDNDLATRAQSDGEDILFTDRNGIRLAHEIELYDSSTGRLIAWVDIPFLSSTEDTSLCMYYGNDGASTQQNPSAVWDSDFVMVQHLEEESTSRLDSTIYGNNGTTYGGVTKDTTGKIDGTDYFDGINDYVRVSHSSSLNQPTAITIECWMNLSTTTNYINLVNKGSYGQYYLRLGPSAGSTYWYVKFGDGTAASVEGNVGWTWNTWHHVVATLDTSAQTIKVYIDGVEKLSGSFGPGKTIAATTSPVLISDISRRWIKGGIDEVRISNVARSASWIQTSYSNEKDPTKSYAAGNEETIPEAPIVFDPSPPDKATNISPSLSELSFNITDSQGDYMNYTVTTSPDIGTDAQLNVSSGKFIINVSGLQYATTYTWTVSLTDGTNWTNMTLLFSTYATEPPTQDKPILIKGEEGNIIGYNQTTYDPDGGKVTNIYNWYRNNTSTTNLLLPFETNNPTITRDYSGYNNNGVIVRGVTWTDAGKVGGAYRFDRGFIQIPGTNTLDGGGQWSEITVEHWIYLTASQGGVRTIARVPSYEIGISGNKIFAGIWIATGSPMISGYNRVTYDVPLNTTTWYHVALTYKSGVGLTLYVNGIAVATKPVSGNIQPSGFNPLYIGWFDYFKGIIDEVKIYPRSLSTQQIYQRYLDTKDGSSNNSTIVSQETNIGDVWRCEVTPNDSHQDGTTKSSNTITIGINNKPTAKDVIIIPTTPTTDSNLTATYAYFDPDGDSENATEIRWYKNGILQPELNNTLTIPFNLTTKGEIWHFTVKPSDGKEYGTLQTSAPVVIQNSPPTIDSYSPLTDPTISEEESQEFSITYSDIDDDNITVQWHLDSTPRVSTDFYTFEANYTSAGTHNVTVVISDGVGQTSHEWALVVNNVNRPPVALFTESAETAYMGESITFNATDSHDPDGPIANYFWNFGDGTNATGVIVSHAYAINGTYTVTLTVTDNDGASNSTSATKTILWNVIPVASFTESAETVYTGEVITFNASTSYDLDGTIVSYFWTFGDGTNATGVVVTHAYVDDGLYTVTLTVTDNVSATGSTSATKTVLNRQPIASFTYSPSTPYGGETATFNATESYDPDGSIQSYAWDFGDGNVTTVTTPIITHVYSTEGTYIVTLTVTDNDEASNLLSIILEVKISP